MKSVGIIGGSGYTGGELIRLVVNHPNLKLEFVFSTTKEKKPITFAHPDLLGNLDLNFTGAINPKIDIVYLCLGNGKSREFLKQYSFSKQTIIVDLGNDFRLIKDHEFQGRKYTYGLPELQKDIIKSATNISNPGCFATAIQLGLMPLAKDSVISSPIHINATTGSSGAGIGLSSTNHFSWRNNNISWYKPFTHQHLSEIYQSLDQLKSHNEIFFMPHRGAYTRGIFATAYTTYKGTIKEAQALYQDYYADHPFTQVSIEEISLKTVVNTNNCFIHLYKYENTLLITSIIDNLIKGASGQAIQNTNLLMGWEENLGLQLKASIF